MALEKRILTDKFCVRINTTMHGMLLVQCFFAMQTWGNPQAEFRGEMSRLAKYLLCNPVLRAEQAAAGGPARSPSSTVHSSRAGSPHSPTDCSEHVLVPLSSIKGYKGAKQQRCNVCNIATSWACITCSPSADVVWPCHPRKTTARKKTTNWACFDKHCTNPDLCPRGARKTKRARAHAEHAEAGDDDDDEL